LEAAFGGACLRFGLDRRQRRGDESVARVRAWYSAANEKPHPEIRFQDRRWIGHK
jgi:hypothetical protein